MGWIQGEIQDEKSWLLPIDLNTVLWKVPITVSPKVCCRQDVFPTLH